MSEYLIFTDGSCFTGDRIGAYAWLIADEDDVIGPEGTSAEDTTISRMELSGPIAALDVCYQIGGPSVCLVYSDSEYVVKGITDRSRARKCNNDLWDLLDEIVDSHALVVFEHVKGHAKDDTGHPYNDAVDKKAGELRKARRDRNARSL